MSIKGCVIEVHFEKYAPGTIHAKHFHGNGPFVVGQKIHLQKGVTPALTVVQIKECFLALKDERQTWVLVVTDAEEG